MPSQAAKGRNKGASISILAIACLLFAFGVIAQNVTKGRSFGLDQKIILALRDPAKPSAPIGPAWLQEAARDLVSLGSIIVVVMITLQFPDIFLARRYATARLMLAAVFGGIALNNLLKAVFPRTLPPPRQGAKRRRKGGALKAGLGSAKGYPMLNPNVLTSHRKTAGSACRVVNARFVAPAGHHRA